MALNSAVSQSCCIVACEHVRCLVESTLLFFHVLEADWKIRAFISILSILLGSRYHALLAVTILPEVLGTHICQVK